MAMTYVDALTVAIDSVDGEVAEKLIALKAQLSKKHSSGDSKAKREADARAEKVFTALCEMDKAVSIPELKALCSDEEIKEWSSSRLSALLRKLILAERVVKSYDKKVAKFAVA